jgi:predicted  nucleic acid-binding Zn-ribbon protein
MHDALQPLQSNCERLRQELAEARESARTMQDSMTQELRQANHRAAIAEAQAAGLREQHALQEATATRLSSRVDELLRQARTVDP